MNANITDIYLIVASTRSGKSTLVNNIVRRILTQRKKSKQQISVFLFNNAAVNADWIDQEFVAEFSLEAVENLNKQKFEKIIIIEDVLSQITSNDDKLRLTGIMSLHRHHNTHYILVSQNYGGLPPSLRMRELSSNIHMFIAKQKRRDRIKTIYESVDIWEDQDQAVAAFGNIKKFEFLYISPDDELKKIKSDPNKLIEIRTN